MKATLLTHMGDDLMVANAARVSFAKTSDWESSQYMDKQFLSNRDTKLLGYLAKHGHWTPFAHPQIQFHMKVPIFVANQLKRHQIGLALNEVSRRYVDDEPEFYFPTEWRLRADNKKQGSSDDILDVVKAAMFDEMYERAVNTANMAYDAAIKIGIAPEMARMILPQNMYTEWYWTGSLAAFARICKQRLDSHAQSETREVAQQLSDQIKPLFPVSWGALMQGDENENHTT